VAKVSACSQVDSLSLKFPSVAGKLVRGDGSCWLIFGKAQLACTRGGNSLPRRSSVVMSIPKEGIRDIHHRKICKGCRQTRAVLVLFE
jgi:hypothetical protein